VNDKKVDIPSFSVSVGDKISVALNDTTKKFLQALVADNSRNVPEWLEFSKVNLTGEIKRLPEKHDIAIIANEQLVVELYSK